MNWTQEELRVSQVLSDYAARGWEVVYAVGNLARLQKAGKQMDIRIDACGVTESPEVPVGR
jgi:hypothetical protein